MSDRAFSSKRFVPAILLLVAVSLVGCGGAKDDEQAGADTGTQAVQSTTATTGGSESPVSSEASGEFMEIQRSIAETIEGINTEEDVKEAEPKLDELYGRLIDLMKKYVTNQEVMHSMPNSPEMKALNDRQTAHIQKLGAENPKAAMALGMVMTKHAGALMEVAGAATKNVDPEEMRKGMEEAKQKMQQQSAGK